MSRNEAKKKKNWLAVKMCASNASAMNLMGETLFSLCGVVLFCFALIFVNAPTYSIAVDTQLALSINRLTKCVIISWLAWQQKSQQTIFNADRSINPTHSYAK